MKHILMSTGALCVVLAHATAVAQQGLAASLSLIVYPSSGQTPTVQTKDESECYQWSRQTTGIDPTNPMAGVERSTAAATPGQGVAAGGGAARGAAAGALIGNIAD